MAKIQWTLTWNSLAWRMRSTAPTVRSACPRQPSASSRARYIVAPAGVTLYRVGTIKHVHLSDAKDSAGNPIAERVYVFVDGGMSG